MSRINAGAAALINSSTITGPLLLEMFRALEVQMNLLKAEGQFAQFQFVDPTDLKEGDIIPEIHLSLRTHKGPLVLEPTELNTSD